MEFLKSELKRERERNENLETILLSRAGYISSPDITQSNPAPVIKTMRRPWSEIKLDLERKDRDKINKEVVTNPEPTAEEIQSLELEVL